MVRWWTAQMWGRCRESALVHRLIGLGAHRLNSACMTDPDDNEFCIDATG